MTICVSIQARLGSTRLPGKVLLPIGEARVLGHVVERCRASSSVDRICVAVGDREENEALAEYCRRIGVDHLQGPEDDLLDRHRLVADDSDSETVVRVTGDCPFLPPGEIDRLVAEYRGDAAPYVTNHTDRMPVGTAVDVLDRSLLERLDARGDTHPVRRLREAPAEWGTVVSGNAQWHDVGAAHIAVDTPADYWRLVDAVDAVGSDPYEVAAWVAERTGE